ncbi:hypothetical protein D3C80_1349750 [compost metagenome]
MHIYAGAADQEQIRRQVHGQRDRARFDAAGLQLFGILLQLGKGHRPIGTHPVRRIVRLARRQLFNLVHRDVLAAEQNVALRNAFYCGDQIVVIAPLHQQQFDVRIIRMADHFHRWPVDRRVIAQEIRALLIGGEDDGMPVRQLVIQRRERLAAPLRLAAEPRGQHARRTLLSEVRRAGEYYRQGQRPVVAAVQEGFREMRQFVFQRQRLETQIQRAGLADVEPQRTVGRIFADVLVMADEHQPHAVKIGDIARVDRHLNAVRLAELFFGEGGHAHQFVIEVHLDVRFHRDQRR